MATTQTIIDTFELLVGDTTELSSDEELALAEKIYRKVLSNRPWEFLKKEFIGATTGATTVTLPADFAYLVDNYNYTDNTIETVQRARPCVVFVGTAYNPYRVVNWSDRRQYRNNSDVCWVNIVSGTLEFAVAPATGQTVSFDYIYNPDALTTATAPVFPSTYYDIIAYGMAVDDMAMQLFDKARSYARENELKYQSYLADMAYYNSQLQMN